LFGYPITGADLGAVSNANQNQILGDSEVIVEGQSSQLFNMYSKTIKAIMCRVIDSRPTVGKVSVILKSGLAQSQTQTGWPQSFKLIKDLKEIYVRSQTIIHIHHAH
tara:strand:+ start:347 stop:667 length:321 start_codon:yes stop_codon:yes gene_type:complete